MLRSLVTMLVTAAFVAAGLVAGPAGAAGNTQTEPDESFMCDVDGDGENDVLYEAITPLVDGVVLQFVDGQGRSHIQASRFYAGAEYMIQEPTQGFPDTVFVSGVQHIGLIFSGELGSDIEDVHLARFLMPRFDVYDAAGNLLWASSSIATLNPAGGVHIQESGACADFTGGLEDL